jgi:hypothetical protein
VLHAHRCWWSILVRRNRCLRVGVLAREGAALVGRRVCPCDVRDVDTAVRNGRRGRGGGCHSASARCSEHHRVRIVHRYLPLTSLACVRSVILPCCRARCSSPQVRPQGIESYAVVNSDSLARLEEKGAHRGPRRRRRRRPSSSDRATQSARARPPPPCSRS